MKTFCESVRFDYDNVIENFEQFLKKGNNPDIEFVQTNDTSWRVKPVDKESYLNDAMLTVNGGGTVTYIVDGYINEDEYSTHIYTLGNGVTAGTGIIRIEVSVDGKEYGWGQMDFSNGNLKITTGAY